MFYKLRTEGQMEAREFVQMSNLHQNRTKQFQGNYVLSHIIIPLSKSNTIIEGTLTWQSPRESWYNRQRWTNLTKFSQSLRSCTEFSHYRSTSIRFTCCVLWNIYLGLVIALNADFANHIFILHISDKKV